VSDPTVVVSDERTEDDAAAWPVDVGRWERLAQAALRSEGAGGELTLTFVDREEIAELNAEHMGKSGPTDVLSFPMDDEPQHGVPLLLGDVVLSPGVAATQFAEHAGTFDDELALLIVHGILHIMGHDHAEPGETARMRRRELELLTAHHWVDGPPPGFRQDHDD
jgi:probable rRNA maturation factor